MSFYISSSFFFIVFLFDRIYEVNVFDHVLGYLKSIPTRILFGVDSVVTAVGIYLLTSFVAID